MFPLLTLLIATTTIAQVRVHERARYEGIGGRNFGPPWDGVAAYYDSLRHITVTSHQGVTREWDGRGLVSPGVPGGSRTVCAWPNSPGEGLGFDEFGTQRYRNGRWQTVTVANSPPLQAGARYALALDPQRQRAVLACDSPLSFWEFDGRNWMSIPSRPFPEAMAFDGSRGRMLVISPTPTGHSEWDGTTWRDLGPLIFGTRHAMCYDAVRRVMVIVSSQGMLYEGNGTSFTQRGTGIIPRNDAGLVWDESRGRCVLIGGWTGFDNLEDVWTWNGTSFQQQLGDTIRPPALNQAMMAHHQSTGCILFGGQDAQNNVLGQTWRFDGTAWTNLTGAGGPPARMSGAMARYGDGVVLFGGVNNGPPLNDTWFYTAQTGWTPISFLFPFGRPSPRQNMAMATDSTSGMTYLFGGTDHVTWFGDLYRIEIDRIMQIPKWNRVTTNAGPSARDIHTMAFDERRQRFVLFGGRNGNGVFLNDTWELDPATSTWTLMQPSRSPGPRTNSAMEYDASRARMVLLGGYDGTFLNEIWEFDGSTWEQRTPENGELLPTENLATAYDPVSKRIVAYGGLTGSGVVSDHTYEILAPTDIAAFAQPNATPLVVTGRPTLRPLGFASIVTPLNVRFDSPLGLAALWFTFGPSPSPVLALSPPFTCQASSLYLTPMLSVPFFQQASISLPASLGDETLTLQGVLFDNPGCWRVTEAWTARMRR